jgi:hypothetical protein
MRESAYNFLQPNFHQTRRIKCIRNIFKIKLYSTIFMNIIFLLHKTKLLSLRIVTYSHFLKIVFSLYISMVSTKN